MNIQTMIKHLKDDKVTVVQIANLIGISILQVQLFADGRSKNPGVKTALGIYRHTSINGGPLIIADFRGKQDIFDKVKSYEEQCSLVIRDEGMGHHDIITTSST